MIRLATAEVPWLPGAPNQQDDTGRSIHGERAGQDEIPRDEQPIDVHPGPADH
jgi:hypothetical protein